MHILSSVQHQLAPSHIAALAASPHHCAAHATAALQASKLHSVERQLSEAQRNAAELAEQLEEAQRAPDLDTSARLRSLQEENATLKVGSAH